MKRSIKILCIVFAASFFAFAACNNNPEAKTGEKSTVVGDTTNRPLAAGEKYVYKCPMCTDVSSDKPGKCPNCGMTMVRTIVKDTVK